jgi:hypothetical protein
MRNLHDIRHTPQYTIDRQQKADYLVNINAGYQTRLRITRTRRLIRVERRVFGDWANAEFVAWRGFAEYNRQFDELMEQGRINIFDEAAQ